MTAKSSTAQRNSPVAEPADRVLDITRVFDAPRSLVFAAWTSPEHVVRWWGPKDFTAQHVEMDVRSGGAWRTCIRSPEGKDYWARGVYREIVEPERLVMTYAWEDDDGKPGHETLVTVTFAEEAKRKTRLTFRHAVFETVESRNSHEGGWSECFDRLEAYLANVA